MQMKPKEMVRYWEALDAFSEKFPQLTFRDVNWREFAKLAHFPPLPFKASVVFLDAVHTMNRNSEKGLFIDLQMVKKIQVQRKGNEWVFRLRTEDGQTIKIQHTSLF